MNNIVSGIMGNTLRRYLIIALMASLAVTGGMFAYAYTISSSQLSVSPQSTDFCSISGCMTVPEYNTFGSYRGKIDAGYLFEFTPDTNYQGDIGINVYLDNIDQIGYKYGMFFMKLDIVDESSANATISEDGVERIVSLSNGVASFISTNSVNFTAGTTYQVRTSGGVYRTYPWSYLSGISSSGSWIPSFTAEVVQAGL